MIPAGSPSVGTYCLFPHPDGFKNILCKVQTHALKSTQSPETSAHQAQPRHAPAIENFILALGCGGKGSLVLSWTMQEGDGVPAGRNSLPGGLSHYLRRCHTTSHSHPSKPIWTRDAVANAPQGTDPPSIPPWLEHHQLEGQGRRLLTWRDGAGWPVFQRDCCCVHHRATLPADPHVWGSHHIAYAASTQLLPVLTPPKENC